MKAIISGGGTGGHIFPAVAIAKAILKRDPNTKILFVGALGRMEMEKIPQQGFEIIGLPISGVQRKLTWKNLLVPFKVIRSLILARKILRDFRPDIVIGVGGYASGPLLRAAVAMDIPSLIQEQNSYAGVTNKILSSKVNRICVAYEGMNRFFPEEKIVLTGNPIRPELKSMSISKENARAHFSLDAHRPVIAVVGGSLGAASINHTVQRLASVWIEKGWQVIWQTGKNFQPESRIIHLQGLYTASFIMEMDMLYAAADVVISRAGAMSIAELCAIGKASILVPSPHVAEDHQTHNAMALVQREAAIMVSDQALNDQLAAQVEKLMGDEQLRNTIAANARSLGKHSADERIADMVFELARKVR